MNRSALPIAVLASVLAAGAAAEVRRLDPPAAEGSRSYSLALAGDGAVFLSWVEGVEEGGHVLRFAELRGDEWGSATTVASGEDWFVNWIDHPAVAPLGGDRLAAHWLVHDEDRQGDYGYGIRLVFSDDRSASWRPAFEARGEGKDGYAGFVAYAAVAGGFEVAYLSSVGDEPVAEGAGEASPRRRRVAAPSAFPSSCAAATGWSSPGATGVFVPRPCGWPTSSRFPPAPRYSPSSFISSASVTRGRSSAKS